jgi:Fe-S cluster assembly scaffold protein SufB
MPAVQETVEQVRRIDVDQYKYGFVTDIESEKAPKGLSEDTVRFISAKKNEPDWMLAWRLEAYRRWLTMREPTWARVDYPKIDYQNAYYYSAPKKKALASLDEVDPEILKTYEKLGIPLREQEILAGVVRPEGERRVAVDAVFDSVSVATTFKEELKRAGVIFMPMSEAIREHPELVKKYLGSVVPTSDNFFATLNSAVFSDGSFVYVPPGVRCPMELSSYFRINEANTGQFERTLIIADKGAYVSYLEGCTAPMRDENQLHAPVVELVAHDDAEIKYSTVQNWYPGDADGEGGIFNFVIKRGGLAAAHARRYPDAGSRPLGDYLEISELYSARRQFTRRVLFDCDLERPPAGRQRDQDAAPRQEHDQPHYFQGHRSRKIQQHLSRPRYRASQGDQRPQLHQLQLAVDRPRRRAYRAVSRSEEFFRGVRARGHHLEDLGGHAVLLPPARALRRGGHRARGQRFRERRAAATADGIRGGSAEADLDLSGRKRGLINVA